MRFSGRFFLVLGGILLATVVAAPPLKLLLDGLIGVWPALADTLGVDPGVGRYDYGRVHRRLFLVLALAIVWANRRWLGSVRLLGVDAGSHRLRMLATGFGAGLASWCAFLGALVLLGRRSFDLDLAPDLLARAGLALVAAVLVGLIEESALRGWLLGGMQREMPRVAAVFLSSAVYSVLHFLKARVWVEVGGFSPGIGLDALVAHVRPLASADVLAPLLGMLLVGVVLSYAYLWSRSLPFAIGLHAGWVFLIMNDGRMFTERLGQRGLYGPDGVLAGPVGWGFLLLLLGALGLAFRQRRPR